MSRSKVTELKTLFIDLNDRSSDNTISQSISELQNAGYKMISLEVKASGEQPSEILQLDIELFGKIKEVQDLPDWVIIKLIMNGGKLKGSGFKERITNG
jgi:hypothetical protein